MSSVLLSSSDDSDFEDPKSKWSLKSKGKGRLCTILSDDDELFTVDENDEGLPLIQSSSQTTGGVEIQTFTVPKTTNNKTSIEDVEFISESFAIGSPSKKKNKKTSQTSLLAFSQQTIKKSGKVIKQDLEKHRPETTTVQCPICFTNIDASKIEAHADSCADNTRQETLDTIASQSNHQFSDILDVDIFDNEVNIDNKWEKDIAVKSFSSKRPSWNLQNSFDEINDHKMEPLNPSKRKRASISVFKPNVISNELTLAPYPELKESAMRGCLRYSGNNPGNSVQSLLKGKPSKQSVTQPSSSAAKSSVSGGFGFKLHPFLAKASSSSCSNGPSAGAEGAVIPDGEGGFIINDDILDDDSEESDGQTGSFPFPSFSSNGFIDFENQFKEKSTPRATKSKAKKSPRKRRFKRGRARGRGRGRGRW